MAIRIDLPKKHVQDALENAISSLRRSAGKQNNEMIVQLIETDIKTYQRALDGLTEVK